MEEKIKAICFYYLKNRNYTREGGPLNPKENFCEKKILSILETGWAINAGNKLSTSKTDATVYGAITTFVSQWQLIPLKFN